MHVHVYANYYVKIYAICFEKRDHLGKMIYSMNQFITTASNILSTKFNVVVILVSVYNHNHIIIVDYSTIHLHGTYNHRYYRLRTISYIHKQNPKWFIFSYLVTYNNVAVTVRK